MPLSLKLAHDPQPASNAPRAIVAEDDEAFRQLISNALRNEGFIVEEVSDGAELFRRVTRGSADGQPAPIDLVLSATSLPGNDGIGLMLGIHTRKLGIPLILITRTGDRKTQVLAPHPDEMLVTNHPFALRALPGLARSLVSPKNSGVVLREAL